MAQPQRLLFKSIEEGDRLKLEAKSNITPSGGGARDIRLPHRPFEPATTKMFPTVVQELRTRDKQRLLVDVRKAVLVWIGGNRHEREMNIMYEPPTSARPSEGRITRVHEIPPLAPQHLPSVTEGLPVVLFIQGGDGRLHAHYTSHAVLANPPRPWYPLARKTILRALQVTPPGHSAAGWIDFTTGQTYIHE